MAETSGFIDREVRLGRDCTIAVRARETYREVVFSAL
jgi:hypothetical protein